MEGRVRGRCVERTWAHDPTLYAPPRYRRACSYRAFVPDPLIDLDLVLAGDTAGIVSEAEAAIASLNSGAQPLMAPLARLLLRSESVASSKIEGMQVDARSLARAEVAQDTGRSIGSEAADILSNIDAMQFAIERTTVAGRIATDDFAAIQGVLMARAPDAVTAGRFRTSQNWIGGNDYNPCGADFVPPPPEELGPLLDDLSRFCDDDALPPIVHAAIAHAQFETIHPFGDGNGRTGRALIHVILRRRGLAPAFVPPISVVLARDKERYVRGLTDFREDRLDAWIEIFAAAAAQAGQLAERYATRVAELQESWRERLRTHSSPRADAAAWAVIDTLPAHPVITVPVGVAATGRTKPAITNAVDQLVGAGVLVPLGESRRNRAWEADGLLDLIAGLESGSG
jgi:Fic family protein